MSAHVVALAPLEEVVVAETPAPLVEKVEALALCTGAASGWVRGGGAAVEYGRLLRHGCWVRWRLRPPRLWQRLRHGLWLATSAAMTA